MSNFSSKTNFKLKVHHLYSTMHAVSYPIHTYHLLPRITQLATLLASFYTFQRMVTISHTGDQLLSFFRPIKPT